MEFRALWMSWKDRGTSRTCATTWRSGTGQFGDDYSQKASTGRSSGARSSWRSPGWCSGSWSRRRASCLLVFTAAQTIHYYEAWSYAAIIVWHFFFVIFHPEEYPMSWTWLTGKMSKRAVKEHHAGW
jgi:hypothetical protein